VLRVARANSDSLLPALQKWSDLNRCLITNWAGKDET
jgi:hypothetical protein